jgi:hypothetical protein
MCHGVKGYKGKEMGVLLGTERGKQVCLEGDTDSEGKVKKVLQLIKEGFQRPRAFIFGSS